MLSCNETLELLKTYDLIGICETWCNTIDTCETLLNGFTCYQKCATRRRAFGRFAGGVAVFVRTIFTRYIVKVIDTYDNTIAIIFDENFLKTEKKILFCYTYVSPEGSSFYDGKIQSNGIQMFEDIIDDIQMQYGLDLHLICAGDFNSRIGQKQDFLDVSGGINDPLHDFVDIDPFNVPRYSKDTIANSFGKSLLSLCCNLEMHVLNGRKHSDMGGEFTYVSHLGKSVIDYITVSTELFEDVKDFQVMNIDISPHFPIVCTFGANYNTGPSTKGGKSRKWTRYKWNDDKRVHFMSKLGHNIVQEKISIFNDLMNVGDVNAAVDSLTGILQYAASDMVCRSYDNYLQSGQPKWWDDDCSDAKREKYQFLNRFRRSNSNIDLQNYLQSKGRFKNLCEVKKQANAQENVTHLCNISNTQELWKQIKRFKGKSDSNNITSDEWYTYFKQLLNSSKYDIDGTFLEEVDLRLEEFSMSEHGNHAYLDRVVTDTEVKNVIRNMNNGKAPGPDGIVTELIKASSAVITPHLVKLYNHVLNTGVFPRDWCTSIICPLHKKGSVNVPDNYRGISLMNVTGKVFTKVLSNRLVSWAENEDKLMEQQAGYRQKYSTIDSCFSLNAAIQKYITRSRGRFYCIFIDFSKAFDCIRHKLLFYVLLKNGVSGKFVNVFQSMYNQLKSCVRSNDGLSDFFDCSIGTKQGCMASPILFVIFLNELIKMIEDERCQGIYINETVPNLLQLLYADDMANFTDTVFNLQKQINVVSQFCSKFGMKVNLNKTKIIVFRRGGQLRLNERWSYMGQPVETVSFYKYLGLYFTCCLSWGRARHGLAEQAEKGIFTIVHFVRKYQATVSQALYLFDHMISPILCYGAELWGYEDCDIIDRVQLKFCKKILNLGNSAPSAGVLGELGRLPMSVYYKNRIVKYWVRLLRMDIHRYPKSCYNMLFDHDAVGRTNWASKIKNMLYAYGFGYAWISQDIGNEDLFLSLFFQRLKDVSYQNWSAFISDSPKLQFYSHFKTLLDPERYLSSINIIKHRNAFLRFRISCHKFAIETGRYRAISRNERFCLFCLTNDVEIIEDELHVLMNCPYYNEIRQQHNITFRNEEHVYNSMKRTDTEYLLRLSEFIFKCMQKHRLLEIN